jgi:alkylhydroperoxidase family enzyme
MDIVPAVGRKVNAVSKDEVKAVSHFRDSELFSEREKAALEYAEEMTNTPVEISNEVFERLKKHFSDEQIVELTSSIAFENYRARLNHALGIESDNLYE